MLKFDPSTLSFTELPPMNVPRAYFKAVLSHNCQFIFAIGGINDNGLLSSVERFDLLS